MQSLGLQSITETGIHAVTQFPRALQMVQGLLVCPAEVQRHRQIVVRHAQIQVQLDGNMQEVDGQIVNIGDLDALTDTDIQNLLVDMQNMDWGDVNQGKIGDCYFFCLLLFVR